MLSQEYPYVPRRLTSRVTAVGIHEGVGHPLILLKSALLRHAAVYGAQLPTLLLPVGHGRLVYCHLLPTVRVQREAGGQKEDRRRRRRQEVIREDSRKRGRMRERQAKR